tara:strand:+ start:2268 stop:3245 length:978 start_codon:yes stop_codon:yes gene_type:complete
MVSIVSKDLMMLQHIILLLQQHDCAISLRKLSQKLPLPVHEIKQNIKVWQSFGVNLFEKEDMVFLLSPVYLIDSEALARKIATPLDYFDSLPSTNDFLLGRLAELESGQLCIAEHQQSGRGRRGKRWFSPYGAHLYQSMYWRSQHDVQYNSAVGLVIGIATAQALHQLGVSGVKVKWPNDIYRDGYKLAGILVESQQAHDGTCHLVIGLGLNISMPNIRCNIDQPFRDLTDVVQGQHTKTDIAYAMWKAMMAALTDFEKYGLAPLCAQWNKYDLFYGQKIQLTEGCQTLVGYHRGIDNQGRLQFEYEDKLKTYDSARVSVRLLSQ